jgi:hypothetical protein
MFISHVAWTKRDKMPGPGPSAESEAVAAPPQRPATLAVKPGQSGLPHEPRPFDEVHHPHGYVTPKERHHWYWYGGMAVFGLIMLATPVIWWQLDTASGPLCRKEALKQAVSPAGTGEVELASVSCLGGHVQQKLFMRHKDGRATLTQTVASFDAAAKVRVRWRTDNEIVVTQRGGRIWSFQPVWDGVKIRYV